jgi:hypothetical protein
MKTGEEFYRCGELIVAAAALLGENGFLSEDPASLSMGGLALANAGRDIAVAYDKLIEGDWELATQEGISPAAENLKVASAALHYCEDDLSKCSKMLESASDVAGCIVMAAAAAPDLVNAAECLHRAGESMIKYGEMMQAGTVVEREAGRNTIEAGRGLIIAAENLTAFGGALANGKLQGS